MLRVPAAVEMLTNKLGSFNVMIQSIVCSHDLFLPYVDSGRTIFSCDD